ncbi:MAG: hypothetical protein [Caudoviricetes sp.]|nr:MAG: hypothetical protein [Caudoviricetes sp.]
MSEKNKPQLKFFEGNKKMPAQDVIAKLSNNESGQGKANAIMLMQDARTVGFGLDAMLHQMVTPADGLTGQEALFRELGVPLQLRDETAIAAFAASSTSFFTNDGLKVLLPSLINNLLRAQKNAPVIERVEDLIVQTRMVKGNVLQKEIEYDKASEDSYSRFRIAETGNIPVRTLKTSQTGVRFYKTGHGIELSYEVASDMTPDVLVPFASRIEYERTRTEHALAVETLINGESTDPTSSNGAAKVDDLDTIDGKAGKSIRERQEGFMQWLIGAARAGRPINTIVVGWDTIMDLQYMFPVVDSHGNAAVGLGGITNTATPKFAQMAVSLVNGVNLNLNVVISSGIESKQILGYRKDETLERLIKASSQIDEMERVIRSQTILYTHTVISGFTLAYGESRRLLKWT